MSHPVTRPTPPAMSPATNGGTMTTPQPPPSDTDRIIAAQQREAHKTRVLLAWIFIGIPLIGLALWGAVAGLAALSRQAQSGRPDTTTVSTTGPLAPGLVNSINDYTPCADVNSWATDQALDAYTGGNAHGVRATFQNECRDHADWTAGEALTQANRDYIAPVTAPTP